jgi:hypothetical protein
MHQMAFGGLQLFRTNIRHLFDVALRFALLVVVMVVALPLKATVNYTRLFLLIFLFPLLASAQTPGLVRWASGSSSNTGSIVGGGTASNYTFRLPEVTQAGNAIALCVVSDDSSNTPTVTDDAPGGSNTWVNVVSGLDSTNHMRARLWLASNVKAGTRTITPAFTATNPARVAVTGAEFFNVGVVDVSNSASSASGSSTMLAGSITPTVSGDLIYQCGVRSQTPSLNVATPYTAGSQSNITWNLQATDNLDGLVSQWGIYNSTAAINPQLTMANASGYVAASMALKGASAGSPLPAGMQIVGIEHIALSKPVGGTTPKFMQFATAGNLLVASIGPGGANYQVSSITDSKANTWTSSGAVLGDGNAGKSQRFYAQNATSGNNLTLTTNWTGGDATTDATILWYDVTGAAASAFVSHQSATNVLDGGVPNGNSLTVFTNVAPGTANGMAFGQMSVAFNTVCGAANNLMVSPATALCDSYSYGGEPINGSEPVDENNGWAHYTFSTNANQTWTWPFQINGQISFYATTLDFFQSASSVTQLAGPGIALVQHRSKDAGTTNSSTLAFPSNNTAGNWIGVCIRAGAVNETFTVTDSRGNTYHKAIQFSETLDGNAFGIYYAENIAGGANTVTVSGTAVASLRIAILEYSGVATSGSLDVVAAAQGDSPTPNSGVTATTTANGDLLLGTIITANPATFTAGTGYRIEESVPAEPGTKLIAGDQIQAAAGAATASATLGVADFWAAGVAAFKAAAGAGGTSPSITSLSPTSGPVGTPVTITGTNFGSTGTVTFGGTMATTTSWSATSIGTSVPTGVPTGSMNVVVTVNGVASNGVNFTLSPGINSLSPTTGPVGTPVTITGTNLGSTGTVAFGGTIATTTSWSATSIATSVPTGVPTGNVNVVVTVSGVASNGMTFTVTSGGGDPKIALVQHTSNDAGITNSSRLTFNSNNTAGNWIGVCIRAGALNEVFTVTDSRGNTYHKAVQFNQNTDGLTFGIYYAENIGGGANTVTVSDTTVAPLRIAILEYSGVATSGSLDVIAMGQGHSTSPSSSPSVNTTANGELLLGAVMTGNPEIFTGGSGYQIEESVPGEPGTKLMVEDQIQAIAGAATVSASLGAADDWAAGLAAFKPAAGAGGTSPSITSANSKTFTVGAAGTFTVGATGTPTPSLTETGALPSGVTFKDNGNGTATLSGTPGVGTGGTYSLTIKAHNGVGTDASQAFTLTVNQAPAITSANNATFTVGAAGTFTVTATGPPTPLLTETGALPSGVTFKDNGNGTGTLSGTPASGTGGTYSITFTASNGVGTAANQSFTLAVNLAPVITSANNATFTVGAAGSFTVTTTGTPTPSLTETGALPSGVTFKDNGNGTATLSGTPASGTGGIYSLTFTATNGAGAPANQSFTLTVNQAPAITSASSTTFTVGAAGSFTVTATGPPTPSLTETGTLPSGVTFLDNGNGTATLSGTPASGTAGSYSLTIKAHNGVGIDASQNFTLTVVSAASLGFVQVNYATPQPPQTKVTVAYTQAQTAGNLNVTVVGWNDSTAQISSVTDSKGNAYVLAVGPTAQSGTATLAIYYAKNIAGAAANGNTVTVTFNTGAAAPDVRIAEYSGIDSTAPVDVVAAAQGSGASSNSGSVNTGNANDLLVGANLVQSLSTAAGPGYTARVITSPDGDILEDRIVSARGSYSATAVLDQTQLWIMQMVAFRAAGSGGGTSPIITSLSPTSGTVGTPVTITGTNFGSPQGTSTVTFNGTTATVTSWSATTIATSVPTGIPAGNVNVVVTVNGVASNSVNFMVSPSITSLSPTIGQVGTPVTISGTNFGSPQGTSTVTFNGTKAMVTSWSAGSIATSVPTGATTGNVVVTVNGVASNGVNFTATTLSVTLSPKRAAVTLSQNQQFTATVNNDPQNGGVSWSVDGFNGGNTTSGSISAAGLFTPGTQPGVHSVKATSNSNTSVSASAMIAVTDLAGMFTYHNDTARTGQNLQEYALTTATVNSSTFGVLFSCPVDGYVYATPLYVANFNIGGQTRNVVFVATEHDSVYAFDADSSSCVQLWHTSFLSSRVTTVPPADTGEPTDIIPEIGITSTPVIDPSTNTIYVVAKTKETVGSGCSSGNPCYFHRLHALDMTTGAEKFGGPVTLLSVPDFVPLIQLQRPALLLNNGTVYIAFGSHGDANVYQGWVMAYNATTLAQQWAWHSTDPSGNNEGGIWGAGNGPALDASGNIYVETANGVFDGINNFSDSVVKLSPAGIMLDFFTPFDQAIMAQNDVDLGSSGPIILPDAVGSAANPHVMIITGKVGVVYLLDQTNLGKYHAAGNQDLGEVSVGFNTTSAVSGFYGQPAYWNGNIYTIIVGDSLRQYSISNGAILTVSSSNSSNTFPFRGATPAVSSSGTTNGIVWVADITAYQSSGAVILDAYDATNVSTLLYSSPSNGSGAAVLAAKFTVPTVANGKVYVGGQLGFTVFGLLPN